MFDVNYWMNFDVNDPEKHRSETPVVYNIETTNACNMRCTMCPRTTLMTRPVETMKPIVFKNIVRQIKPHSSELWAKWVRFVEEKYGVMPDEQSENHFFLYIIPYIIQLHGYGEPLLDKNMGNYVEHLADKGFLSYFSCNPANINSDTIEILKRGLGYVKFSVESVDDETHKSIRGNGAYCHKILELLNEKEQKELDTQIIVTMLDLNRENQQEDFEMLKEYFKGTGAYVYFKSQDTQWLNKDYHGTTSIHWSEPCKHPWMSMTIKSNGEATQCMEDFNNAIVLGDTKKESLYDIWNGEKYKKLRQDHLKMTKGIQCTERCDMKLVGDYVQ